MVEADIDKRSCTNCGHFVQHYAITGGRIHNVVCGHCLIRKLTPKQLKSFPFVDGCEEWTNEKEKIKRDLVNVENVLRDMANGIKQIETVLEELNKKLK